jgi:hypothetical protein
MNRILASLLAVAVLTAACNNNKKPNDATVVVSDNGKEKVSVNIDQMKDAAEKMQQVKQELEKLPQLTTDQLKAMLPESLIGGKRTSFDVSSNMGASGASAEYEINDSTRLTLNILDCAGPAGAGLYSMQFLSQYNIQQETEEEYTKTIELNGDKGFEQCDKTSRDCTVTYFTGGRFLVSLEGKKIPVEALKEAASHMKLK